MVRVCIYICPQFIVINWDDIWIRIRFVIHYKWSTVRSLSFLMLAVVLFFISFESNSKKKQTHGVYLMAQRMNVVCTLFKNAVVANFSDVHMCASISSSGKNEFN